MSCSARIAGVYVHHFWLTGHPIFKQQQTILYFTGDPLKFVFKNHKISIIIPKCGSVELASNDFAVWRARSSVTLSTWILLTDCFTFGPLIPCNKSDPSVETKYRKQIINYNDRESYSVAYIYCCAFVVACEEEDRDKAIKRRDTAVMESIRIRPAFSFQLFCRVDRMWYH